MKCNEKLLVVTLQKIKGKAQGWQREECEKQGWRIPNLFSSSITQRPNVVTAFNVRVGDKNPCTLVMRYPRVHLELTYSGNVFTSVRSNIKVTQLMIDTGIAVNQFSDGKNGLQCDAPEHIYTFHLVPCHRHNNSVLHQPTWLEIGLVHVLLIINLFHMSNAADPPLVSGVSTSPLWLCLRAHACEGVALHPGGKWSLPCVVLLAVNHYRPYQWSAGVFDWFVKMCTMIQTRTGKMFRHIFIIIVVKNSC